MSHNIYTNCCGFVPVGILSPPLFYSTGTPTICHVILEQLLSVQQTTEIARIRQPRKQHSFGIVKMIIARIVPQLSCLFFPKHGKILDWLNLPSYPRHPVLLWAGGREGCGWVCCTCSCGQEVCLYSVPVFECVCLCVLAAFFCALFAFLNCRLFTASRSSVSVAVRCSRTLVLWF